MPRVLLASCAATSAMPVKHQPTAVRPSPSAKESAPASG